MAGAVPLLAIFHHRLVVIGLHYHEAGTGGLMPTPYQLHALPFLIASCELSLC